MKRAYLVLLSLFILAASACQKEEDAIDLEGQNYIQATIDGEQILLNTENLNTFNEDEYANAPNASVLLPYRYNGTEDYSLGKFSYTSSIVSKSENMELKIIYTTIVDSSLIGGGSTVPFRHKDAESIFVFDPQTKRFSDQSNTLGIVVYLTYLDSGRTYSTITNSIGNDSRFSFAFTQTPKIETNTSTVEYEPTFVSTAKGTFSCVLYSMGDSITISNAKFRLPFAE